jgi:glycosyltransferase involved in cell wall biosynthesis
MKVLFLLHAPDAGGTERQMRALLAGLDPALVRAHLALLFSGGGFADAFAALRGVSIHHLTGRGSWTRAALPGALVRLVRLARALRPDVVCAMLPGANEAALLAGRLSGARVVTGIRCTMGAWGDGGAASALGRRAGALLCRASDLVISNSRAGQARAVRLGCPEHRIRVVPNGIDAARFAPDPAAGARLRAAWGVAPGVPLVGQFGRLDPMKDHPTFLRAAALVRRRWPEARFVCLGRGPEPARRALAALAGSLGLAGAVLWPGHEDDMPAAYNALDVLCLSSAYGEGFPNVLGEGMACARPCAATDVGDAALMLGGLGPVVPPGDFRALGAALAGLLDEGPEALAARGARCRERVEERYGVARMAEAFTAHFQNLARGGRPCAA